MKLKLIIPTSALIGIVLLFLANFPAANAQEYTITDLGTLGGTTSYAYALNDLGQVVGVSSTSLSTPYGFLWENGVMTNLGVDHAFDINNLGQIVGQNSLEAFLWENGTLSKLESLGGSWSMAKGINEAGQIVGASKLADGEPEYYACIWENDTVTDLGTLGGDYSNAQAINESGQIVGAAKIDSVHYRAFVWEGGVMTNLGTLGDHSGAIDINSLSKVVGASGEHAFLWTEDREMLDLGTLGGNWSAANAINDSDQIVGTSKNASGDQHAVLWDNNEMFDLNDLLVSESEWELIKANDINNVGQIVGSGNFNGETHAFLLTPVPEPALIYSCVGFEPPCNSTDVALTVKKNKCIPLKTELIDENGISITDADLEYPPVLASASFAGGAIPSEVATVGGLPPSQATDGNQFEFIGGRWCFNLKVKDHYSGPGTYTFEMVSGNQEEYVIEPTCTVTIVVEK